MKNLSKRQKAILDFINIKKEISTTEILAFIKQTFEGEISRITILRDIEVLLKCTLIKKQGNARSIKYIPLYTSKLLEIFDIDAYFKVDFDNRTIKNDGFDFEIFKNLSNLFPEYELSNIELLNNKFKNNFYKMSNTLLKKELERLTIEFSWKSSQIEGNTYSLLDTERLIKDNVEAAGHKKEEAVMILNHKKTLDYIFQDKNYYKEITLSKIEDIHRLLIENLDVTYGLRNTPIGITGTNYRPLDNKYQINEAMEQLINIINNTINPFEKALISVLMISYIQPFEDGNKRTSRILGNAILLAHDYCPLSYRSVDEVEYKKAIILFYEQNSISYFKHLFVEQFKQAVEKYF